MGHLTGKDLYRQVGAKLDTSCVRAPWSETLRAALELLFTPQEAQVFVGMPYSLAPLERVARAVGLPPDQVAPILEGLAAKGLVIDFFLQGRYHWMPSPLCVGVFEFTMMRTGPAADLKALARLFHDYFESGEHLGRPGLGMGANFGAGQQVSFMRVLPHEGTLAEHVEILDHERVAAILEQYDQFSVNVCACRHAQEHLGGRQCAAPLETCSSIGRGADYLIRHGLARAASREEMREHFARSAELGLVLSADNVNRGMTFICHCCPCCCTMLRAISRSGFENALVTTRFLPHLTSEVCRGCGACVKACPIGAITLVVDEKGPSRPMVDETACLGCGVCALRCPRRALSLRERGQRVIHPEDSFARVVLQSLERGTLEVQVFDDPQAISHRAMRALLGAFLRLPPVKQALMSDLLRSAFLRVMRLGVRLQGRSFLLDI